MTDQRHQDKVKRHIASEAWSWVERLLREDWSPKQISEWLMAEKSVRIYQYVYKDKRQGGDLHRHLRCQKARKKRYGSYDRRGQIKGRVSIEERPSLVDQRVRIGDWEADTMIGQPGGLVLVTLVERKSRLTRIAWTPDKTAQAVTDALLATLQPVAAQVHTLTYDNGKEFAYHQAIAKALQAQRFFAHPYHSWKRGLNENTNGLIRQYLPKGSDFQHCTLEDIQNIMDKLNHRSRKCLDYKTPNQVFFGINPPVALAS